jgi:DMSO/TMAO reductase YedYZ molybdopterin-dependent catalytic subunit
VRYPGKTDLMLLTSRPPQLETPAKYFESAITPNEAFYVRYHIPPPTEVDLATWRLKVAGHVDRPVELSLDDLQSKFPRASIVAVNQCSGNGRGYFSPRVFGGQWANGAMGNAEWTGVRLRDILSAAGVRQGAVDVSFNGLDQPAMPTVPDFVKSLSISRIMEDPNVLVAYQMNGQPLPMLNGFPARLIVPGWTGTYWMKHLISITALTKPQGGFWMKPAYRIPVGKFPVVARFVSQEDATSTPITEMVVNSLITSHTDGAKVKPGKVSVSGLAWDGGYGIRSVEVSTDGGKTWSGAKLGDDLGRYAFRPWSFDLNAKPGKNTVMANATNAIGQSQVATLIWNPAGYHNNVMQTITLNAG